MVKKKRKEREKKEDEEGLIYDCIMITRSPIKDRSWPVVGRWVTAENTAGSPDGRFAAAKASSVWNLTFRYVCALGSVL